MRMRQHAKKPLREQTRHSTPYNTAFIEFLPQIRDLSSLTIRLVKSFSGLLKLLDRHNTFGA